jgi:hypothetical protein
MWNLEGEDVKVKGGLLGIWKGVGERKDERA